MSLYCDFKGLKYDSDSFSSSPFYQQKEVFSQVLAYVSVDCKPCDDQDIMGLLAHSGSTRNICGIELGVQSRFYFFILE